MTKTEEFGPINDKDIEELYTYGYGVARDMLKEHGSVNAFAIIATSDRRLEVCMLPAMTCQSDKQVAVETIRAVRKKSNGNIVMLVTECWVRKAPVDQVNKEKADGINIRPSEASDRFEAITVLINVDPSISTKTYSAIVEITSVGYAAKTIPEDKPSLSVTPMTSFGGMFTDFFKDPDETILERAGVVAKRVRVNDDTSEEDLNDADEEPIIDLLDRVNKVHKAENKAMLFIDRL